MTRLLVTLALVAWSAAARADGPAAGKPDPLRAIFPDADRFDAADVLFRRVKAAQPASANVDHLLDVLAQNFKSNEWQPLADKLPRVLFLE